MGKQVGKQLFKMETPLGLLVLLLSAVLSCATTKSQRVYLYHTTEKYDSLDDIAKKYDTTWYEIVRDNHLKKNFSLAPGMILKIFPGYTYLSSKEAMANCSFEKGLCFEGNSSEMVGKSRFKKAVPVVQSADPDFDISFINPIKDVDISSKYGPRWGRFHHGVDYRANRHTPILASHDGVVIYSGWQKGYGRVVKLRHPETEIYTIYAHCQRLKVRKGSRVFQGQPIATVGKSGNATGYHLHFEVRKPDRKSIDPISLIKTSNPSMLLTSRSSEGHFPSIAGSVTALPADRHSH